jgi:hypothetical protein
MRISMSFVILSTFMSLPSWCAAQDTPSLKVDGNLAKAYIAHLSSDAMQGRASGTEGYRQASEWVAATFQQWGLQPAGEDATYFQKVTIHDFESNLGIPTLRVGSREFYFDDNDFLAESAASSAGVTISGEIVFVGYGIAAPDKGLNEYDGLDVNGRIVLAFRGSPHTAPQLRRPLENEPGTGQPQAPAADTQWTEEAKEVTKIKTAYGRGAAAILLYDPDESPDEQGRRRRSYHATPVEPFQPERGFLCFTITERVFRAIMRPNPQESPRGLKRRMDTIRRDIQNKKTRSGATGIQVAMKGYDQTLRIDEKSGNNFARNVLARIEGTDPQLKSQYVLVGAHLDHVGMRNGYVYNGADDNASGSGVVMEVARALAQGNYKPKRTLIFALWCGEEQGLLGSLHYTKHPCAGVTMDNIVADFNLDMVGMGEKLEASGALNFPAIWEVIQRNQDPEIMKVIQPSTGGPSGSDHTGFILKGIESVFLIGTGGVGHEDYHQPEDDIDKIEPEMLRRSGQFVLQGMVNLADEIQVNLLVDRRQDLYRAVHVAIANLNPQLKDSSWTVVDLKADNKEALYDQVLQAVRQLVKPAPAAEPTRGSGGGRSEGVPQRPAKSVSRGLARMELIGTDPRLLDLVLELYGIGRVDVAADNPFWVKDGRLTSDGRSALAALQERRVAIHLVSPGIDLMNDVLDATSKPFAITGTYEIREDSLERLSSRGILWGVNFDPKAVGDFLARVEQLKTSLGERRNLFAYLVSAEGLEEAKTPLYMGLLDRGWAQNEIAGSREHRGLLGGATLNALSE